MFARRPGCRPANCWPVNVISPNKAILRRESGSWRQGLALHRALECNFAIRARARYRNRGTLKNPRGGPISATTRSRSVTKMVSPLAANCTYSLSRLLSTGIPTVRTLFNVAASGYIVKKVVAPVAPPLAMTTREPFEQCPAATIPVPPLLCGNWRSTP